jgi:hypothetical protein
MARASAATLEQLASLLADIRTITTLTERSAGVFYMKREPMLHFHATDGAIVAHLKAQAGGFDEFAVNTNASRAALLAELKRRCTAREKSR